MSNEELSVPPHRLREIAVLAGVHPTTVSRVLAGRPTRAQMRERVELAMKKLGIFQVGADK